MRKKNEILESLTVSYGADLSRKLVALQGDSFISEEASIDRTKSICIIFDVLLFGPPAIQSSQFRKGFCHCHNGLNLKKGGALTGKQLWSTRWNEEIRKLKTAVGTILKCIPRLHCTIVLPGQDVDPSSFGD